MLRRRTRRQRGRWDPPGLGEDVIASHAARCVYHMHGFDSVHPAIREIMRATHDQGRAIMFYNAGIRTFEEAERAIARGEQGVFGMPPVEILFPALAAPEGERLRRVK